jgi:Cu-Zn family superoxide dismutase
MSRRPHPLPSLFTLALATALAFPALATAATAKAELAPTAGNNATGSLTLESSADGVRLEGRVQGLSPGAKHGFHVHETGDCSAADASSAGAHFNPGGHAHAGPDDAARHLGDLGNLQADDQGVANVALTIAGATLGDRGPNDLLGRAVIVHAAPDDLATQPTGNAGARIACAVIE